MIRTDDTMIRYNKIRWYNTIWYDELTTSATTRGRRRTRMTAPSRGTPSTAAAGTRAAWGDLPWMTPTIQSPHSRGSSFFQYVKDQWHEIKVNGMVWQWHEIKVNGLWHVISLLIHCWFFVTFLSLWAWFKVQGQSSTWLIALIKVARVYPVHMNLQGQWPILCFQISSNAQWIDQGFQLVKCVWQWRVEITKDSTDSRTWAKLRLLRYHLPPSLTSASALFCPF